MVRGREVRLRREMPIEDVLVNMVLLWATGAQALRGPLGECREPTTELPHEGKEAGVLMHQWIPCQLRVCSWRHSLLSLPRSHALP